MIQLIMGILDVSSMTFAAVVVIMAIKIYKTVCERGFLYLLIASAWMLLIRLLWVALTITKPTPYLSIKEILGVLAFPHWFLLMLAMIKIHRDTKKILKK